MVTKKDIYELNGVIDKNHNLLLEDEIPIEGPRKVKLMIILEDDEPVRDEEFIRAVETGGAFKFWHHPDEDAYTIEDGKPVE